MSEREELKPCPLCGKKVSIARIDDERGERWWFITRGTYKTTRCNCRLFLESKKFTCDWNDAHALECRRKLIETWNTRATLGVEECEMVTSGTPCTGNTDKRCTSCGAFNIGEFYDGQDHIVTTPRFCPNCGKAVKR